MTSVSKNVLFVNSKPSKKIVCDTAFFPYEFHIGDVAEVADDISGIFSTD